MRWVVAGAAVVGVAVLSYGATIGPDDCPDAAGFALASCAAVAEVDGTTYAEWRLKRPIPERRLGATSTGTEPACRDFGRSVAGCETVYPSDPARVVTVRRIRGVAPGNALVVIDELDGAVTLLMPDAERHTNDAALSLIEQYDRSPR